MLGDLGAKSGLRVPLCLLFHKGTLGVVDRCGDVRRLSGVKYGSSAGEVLRGLIRVTKVGGGVACRATQRAYTALLMRRNIPVAAMRQVLKRASIEAARVCSSIFTRALVGSLALTGRGDDLGGVRVMGQGQGGTGGGARGIPLTVRWRGICLFCAHACSLEGWRVSFMGGTISIA